MSINTKSKVTQNHVANSLSLFNVSYAQKQQKQNVSLKNRNSIDT